jgi:hypothetical protein
MTIRLLPYPPSLRSGRKFEDEREMLRWVLERIFHSSRRDVHLVDVSPQDQLVLDAAMPLLRAACALADAIWAISRRRILETSYPLLRSLLEVWADFRLLLSPGSPADRAALMRLWAAHAIADYHEPTPGEIKAELTRLKKLLPEQFKVIESRRAKSKTGHWSGTGRKRLITEQCGPEYGKMYELLSWDTHPIVQVLLDVDTVKTEAGSMRRYAHRSPQGEVQAEVIPTTVHIIINMWNEFAAYFGKYSSRRGAA